MLSLKQFRNKFSGLPIDENDMANTIIANLSTISDKEIILHDLATKFIIARSIFLEYLDDCDIELG